VNLINLNTSRILERASEIGVRKAFGRSSWTLVGQFIVENLVLTLVGAAVGFVLAGWLLGLLNGSGLIEYADLAVELPNLLLGRAARRGIRPAVGRVSGLAHVAAAPRAGAEGNRAMIRHVFKLIWNRKRTNFLMVLEIFVSFIVLFAVVGLGVYTLDNWRRPIGFSYDRVWDVSIDMKQVSDDDFTQQQAETVRQVMLVFRSFRDRADGGHHACAVRVRVVVERLPVARPHDRVRRHRGHDGFGGPAGPEDRGGTLVRSGGSRPAVLAGRHQPGDARGACSGPARRSARPSIRTKSLVRAPQRSGSGAAARDPGVPAQDKPRRIVGVVEAYREDGEFDGTRNYVIYRKDLDVFDAADRRNRPPRNKLIKVRAGTTAELQERLIKRLQAAAPSWSFEVTPLSDMRSSAIEFALVPLVGVGLVAAFLMLMVALGLLGVLWQSVTQRTREIGLRRAKGRRARERPASDPRRDCGHDDAGADRRRARRDSVPAARHHLLRRAARLRDQPCDLGDRHLSSDVGMRVVPEPDGDTGRTGRGAQIRVADDCSWQLDALRRASATALPASPAAAMHP
jgi:putative ABC transport system permease protein